MKTIADHDVIRQISKTTTAPSYVLSAHSKQTKVHSKQIQRKRKPNTLHCRQSGKQTARRLKKLSSTQTALQSRIGALNALRSARREKKDKREVEQARDATET